LPTILIVDDHAVVRTAVRGLFESCFESIVCGEAENGADAIVKAKELEPDLIVLDVSMPVMNGLEAAKISPPDFASCASFSFDGTLHGSNCGGRSTDWNSRRVLQASRFGSARNAGARCPLRGDEPLRWRLFLLGVRGLGRGLARFGFDGNLDLGTFLQADLLTLIVGQGIIDANLLV